MPSTNRNMGQVSLFDIWKLCTKGGYFLKGDTFFKAASKRKHKHLLGESKLI